MNTTELKALVKSIRPGLPRPPKNDEETKAWAQSQVPDAVKDLMAYLDHRSIGDLLEVGICHAGTACSRVSRLPSTRQFIAVDPFGDVAYAARDGGTVRMYDDDIGRKALANLFFYGHHFGVNIQYWKMLSTDWVDIILPRGFISGGTWRPYAFGNAFLDGSHESPVVALEIEKVTPHLTHGGTIIIDNIDYEQPDGTLLADGILAAAEKNGLKCILLDSNDDQWNWDPVAVLCKDSGVLERICAD